ncbi:MAG: ABC transporter ATP-binding protein [Anaerolineae bacterium]|jgi:ABC-2 type transport system ATP-binding protein|nr:ABC transporter ATP-binding protein [Anaerolineae bacterium]
MAAMVEVRGLKKSFTRPDGTPVHAVKGVSFDITKGEIFSLLGPNGAGKSTTIGMISGLVTPSAGEARIGGFSITQQAMAAKALIGVVPQDIALYPQLSPRQNLDFFGRMYGLGGAALNKQIDEVIEFIDLKDRQNDRVDTFSGGMKRRVNIGVGLLHKPQLVYMDEPTVGVDPQSRRRILDTVFRMRDEYNMTVLYTTHLMEESQELSDRVAIIDHGEIIAMGTQVELMAQAGEEDRLVLSVAGQLPAGLVETLARVPGVSRAIAEPTEDGAEESRISVYAKSGRKSLPDVLRAANDAGATISSVAVKEPDLETLFLNLTGRALRD